MALKLDDSFQALSIQDSRIQIRRGEEGTVYLRGKDDLDLARALGFAHACDRMLQMMLVRVIAQGRLSEFIKDDDSTFEIDVFMRERGLAADAKGDQINLSPEARRFTEAYCAGVNTYLDRYGYPWEFRLVGYCPDPWTPEDVLLTIKLMCRRMCIINVG